MLVHRVGSTISRIVSRVKKLLLQLYKTQITFPWIVHCTLSLLMTYRGLPVEGNFQIIKCQVEHFFFQEHSLLLRSDVCLITQVHLHTPVESSQVQGSYADLLYLSTSPQREAAYNPSVCILRLDSTGTTGKDHCGSCLTTS